MFNFLKTPAGRVVTALLLLQGVLLHSSVRDEFIPTAPPLSQVPLQVGPWRMVEEGVVDAETMAVLQADDTLSRTYADGKVAANLFVASFRSQRTGKAPHSPKNCLPGSGWLPLDDRIVSIDSGKGPIDVNRYVIAYGDNRSLVLYWYQSRDRAVASEYKAKFWVVADAMRYNRTDTALVRVIVPIVNKDDAAAQRTAEAFVKSMYSTVVGNLPS